MQYTIRKIPAALDKVIRGRARAGGKSINEIAVAALVQGLGLGSESMVRRDLGDIAGTWTKDKAVDEALAAQDRVDPDLWK
ncbi:MAG: hypothetical protein HY017_20520 [Betaproteobacteria bacterium]|nr:hypothetical protein [Betaproteobacteria bacterium]